MDIPYLLVLGTKPEQEKQDHGLDNLFANITVKVSFYLPFSPSHQANVFFLLLLFLLCYNRGGMKAVTTLTSCGRKTLFSC